MTETCPENTLSGTVTHVNQELLFFELDNSVKIHMAVVISQNDAVGFPRVGADVRIKNAHYSNSNCVICHNSILIGDFTDRNFSNDFLDIVKSQRLSASDLCSLNDNLKKMEISFIDLSYQESIELTIAFLKYVFSLPQNQAFSLYACCRKNIPIFNIIPISNCRYVEVFSNKYKHFPRWSFGIHSKPNTRTLLFGCFNVHEKFGFLVLKDSIFQIACVIYNAPNKFIHSLNHCYVLIKKYKIVTEIFNDSPNFEYICVDFDDVVILYKKPNLDIGFIDFDGSLKEHSKQIMSFKLERRSVTRLGQINKPEIWLQIVIVSKNDVNISENAFLRLPSKYVEAASQFEEHGYYKIFYEGTLKSIKNFELQKISNQVIYELGDQAVFQRLNKKDQTTNNILNVKECKEFIARNSNLITFQGKLKKKRFSNKLSKNSPMYGFGTSGNYIHQLVFSYYENGHEYFLDCYINDWERQLAPLGLIPQMRVLAKNVLPQSRKYLKSCIFTSFEILSYEPVIDFHTANLYENEHDDWGEKFFLGYGNDIPCDVIIWGKVWDIQIMSVKIQNNCSGCKVPLEYSGPCKTCQKERVLNFTLNMIVSDEHGQGKVLVEDIKFIQILLNMYETQFETLKNAIQELDYEYEFLKENFCKKTINNSCLKNNLTNLFDKINDTAVIHLALKCRRIATKSFADQFSLRSTWLYIDARKC